MTVTSESTGVKDFNEYFVVDKPCSKNQPLKKMKNSFRLLVLTATAISILLLTASCQYYSQPGLPASTLTPVIHNAKLVDQYPLDGYICPTGEQLDFKITLQNVGNAPWKAIQFYIKRMYNSPDIRLTNYDLYPLVADIPPGEKGTFTIDVACPTFPGGPWTTQWALVNDNGEIFAKFFFRFYTGVYPTKTPAKTPTKPPG